MTEHRNETDSQHLPAYKHKWFWFVISPLLLVVVACAITITIAVQSADDRVVGDYYREGLLVNQKRDRREQAEAMGLRGQLNFDNQIGEVVLDLQIEQLPGEGGLPEQLTLKLSHPAFAERDHSIELRAVSPEVKAGYRYVGNLERPLENRWYWQLTPVRDTTEVAPWQMRGEIDFAEGHSTAIRNQ